jgi:hypothetical protein
MRIAGTWRIALAQTTPIAAQPPFPEQTPISSTRTGGL